MKKAVMKIECPLCKGKATVSYFTKKIPNFGNVLFTTIQCKECKLKISDVMQLDVKEPKAFVAEIKNEEDLKTKVIRASSGTIKLKEFGIEIEPGPLADGFYTNVEGVLDRCEARLKAVLNSPISQAQYKNAKKIFQKIKAAKQGKVKFTIEILDPFGNSALIGKNVRERKLTKKEIAELKTDIIVFETKRKKK